MRKIKVLKNKNLLSKCKRRLSMRKIRVLKNKNLLSKRKRRLSMRKIKVSKSKMIYDFHAKTQSRSFGSRAGCEFFMN